MLYDIKARNKIVLLLLLFVYLGDNEHAVSLEASKAVMTWKRISSHSSLQEVVVEELVKRMKIVSLYFNLLLRTIGWSKTDQSNFSSGAVDAKFSFVIEFDDHYGRIVCSRVSEAWYRWL